MSLKLGTLALSRRDGVRSGVRGVFQAAAFTRSVRRGVVGMRSAVAFPLVQTGSNCSSTGVVSVEPSGVSVLLREPLPLLSDGARKEGCFI